MMFKSEYKDGAWIHPADLDDSFGPSYGNLIYYPRVSMNSKGDALVAYQMVGGSALSLLISEYFNGQWTHPETLRDSITPDASLIPNLVPGFANPLNMNNKGQAIISWVGYDTLLMPSVFTSLRK